MTLVTAYSYVCAALALTGALCVVIGKNPIRCAMGLLLLILSVAGLFIALDAQFLAAIQLIVYAGAIVILFLFVIMLLGPHDDTQWDHKGLVARVFGGGLFALSGLGALTAVARAAAASGAKPIVLAPVPSSFGGVDTFGSVLFSTALVPFELSSALLMVAVVGAIAVARGRQGFHTLSRGERKIQDAPAVTTEAGPSTGVFSHEIHLGESHAGDAKGGA
ncbi:MAG TPA: NADH-quinone oxidoreductase subunit J [Polyangiaceae bacterium]|jgi:NADH-quinone oxidoreductase subunit J|nr:NADH-quinone oxidoreductase subunit J [Polyangiaceae bacterium]